MAMADLADFQFLNFYLFVFLEWKSKNRVLKSKNSGKRKDMGKLMIMFKYIF